MALRDGRSLAQLLENDLSDGGSTLVGAGGAQPEGGDMALFLRGLGCDEKTYIASSYLGEVGQAATLGYQGHETQR